MNKRTAIVGIALIALGFIFWLNQLDMIDVSFGEALGVLFPLALIAVGVWMILRTRRSHDGTQVKYQYDYQYYGASTDGKSTASAQTETGQAEAGPSGASAGFTAGIHGGHPGKIRYDKFAGDLFVDLQNVEVQNVEVSSFIGDVEIKLHGARLVQGLNRMVISGFVGDVRIMVPPGMPVFVQTSNFVGDTELLGRRTSGFGNTLDTQSANYATADSKLYIAVNFFISDVRVYEV